MACRVDALAPAPAPSPRRLAGGLWVALCLALLPGAPHELPPLHEGGKVTSHDPVHAEQWLAATPADPQKAQGASSSPSSGSRRGADTPFAPPLVCVRDVAMQLRLSLSEPPPPAMHLSAQARSVLFPEQGPPARRA